MRLLILGGTVFLGRHLSELALARGHELTLFNRGLHNAELFPEAEKLRGDRGGDLDALRGRSWDAVVDTCGFVPRDVGTAAEILAAAVEHYTYVSSISAYRDWPARAVDEESPTYETRPEGADDGDYGELKAGCERAVLAALPDRCAIARVGLLVGPHDNVFRLPWWVSRIARGGEVLAPAPADRRLQLIDARDLAVWLLDMAEDRRTGIYNATAPPGQVTMGELLESARAATGSDASLEWVDEGFLVEEGVEPWTELPLWAPDDAEGAGLWEAAADRAAAVGLSLRPVDRTVADVWSWLAVQGAPPEGSYRAEFRAPGLAPDRERELLRHWRERGGG